MEETIKLFRAIVLTSMPDVEQRTSGPALGEFIQAGVMGANKWYTSHPAPGTRFRDVFLVAGSGGRRRVFVRESEDALPGEFAALEVAWIGAPFSPGPTGPIVLYLQCAIGPLPAEHLLPPPSLEPTASWMALATACGPEAMLDDVAEYALNSRPTT